MTIPVLKNAQARRLFLHRHGLCHAGGGAGRGDDLAAVLDDLGFVQLDSVNTFARAHDLILWARRGSYRPRALELALARDRAVFEHWTHDAAAIPMAFYPHWKLRFDRDAARLRDRWGKDRRAGFLEKAEEVLAQIQTQGGCSSSDVGTDEVKGSGGWWDWHPSKTALEYLWRSGALTVCHRTGFRKVYDLPERVIPAEHLNARPHPDETIDWLCAGALDRLGFATSGELAAFWDTATPAEAKEWCRAALADGRVIEVDVEGVDGRLRRSFAPPGVMDAPAPAPPGKVRIVSPFDPALRDRKRAERLFGFHYRIEIFVPEAKRQYGYYVFPVMEGDRLIGRIDMKREGAVLAVRAFWPERGVRIGSGRLARLQSELARASRFGGCGSVELAEGWLRG